MLDSRKIQYPKMLGSREGILGVARTSSKLHLFLQTNKQTNKHGEMTTFKCSIYNLNLISKYSTKDRKAYQNS